MTTTSATTSTQISVPAQDDHTRARRALVPAAVAAVLLTAAFDLLRADTRSESFSMIAFDVVVGGLVFAVLVPRGLRHDSAGARALACGILAALLAFPAFWSGLPLLLGVAAALLGYAGKRAATRSGMCIAALVLGTLASLAYVTIYVADWVAHPGISWIAGGR